MRAGVALTTIALIALASCERRKPPPDDPPGSRWSVGVNGRTTFELTMVPDPPILGEIFQVVTRVRDARTREPISGATLTLDATMKEHGHGMTTAPEHREIGGGSYVSDGMKLHMPGRWTFTVRATRAGVDDEISIPFEQPFTARR